MRICRRQRSRGFTLLEVLVALSILALSYGVILQIFGGAAQKAGLASDYRRAMIVAESQLEYAAANVEQTGIPDSGLAQGKYAWKVSIAPTNEFSLDGVPARYTPLIIRVEVSWDDGSSAMKSVDVSTIRLKRGRAG